MDPAVLKLFEVMMAIFVPVALGGGVYVLVASFAKRLPRARGVEEGDDVQQLRERLEELEQRETRIQEIEERLDFIERVLPQVREGSPVREFPPSRPAKTPS